MMSNANYISASVSFSLVHMEKDENTTVCINWDDFDTPCHWIQNIINKGAKSIACGTETLYYTIIHDESKIK